MGIQRGLRKAKAKRFSPDTGGVVITRGDNTRSLSVNSASIKDSAAATKNRDGIFTNYVGDENADISNMTHEFGHLIFSPGDSYRSLSGQKELNDWFQDSFKHTDLFRSYDNSSRVITKKYNSLFNAENSKLAAKYRAKDITRDEYETAFHLIDKKIKSE